VGFFLGGLLLTWLGFRGAVLSMALVLCLVWVFSLINLTKEIGLTKSKPKLTSIFSKNRAINYLSAARMFLFGSRDVWFVIALPVFLASELAWSHTFIGGFLAVWIILYGLVQSIAPKIVNQRRNGAPNGRTASTWAMLLVCVPILIAISLQLGWPAGATIIIGLLTFGAIFAINSALHSYLIIQYASAEEVSLDVGFYYMANAMGRLFGTILSGLLFQLYGLPACLAVSAAFVLIAALLSLNIDSTSKNGKAPI